MYCAYIDYVGATLTYSDYVIYVICDDFGNTLFRFFNNFRILVSQAKRLGLGQPGSIPTLLLLKLFPSIKSGFGSKSRFRTFSIMQSFLFDQKVIKTRKEIKNRKIKVQCG